MSNDLDIPGMVLSTRTDEFKPYLDRKTLAALEAKVYFPQAFPDFDGLSVRYVGYRTRKANSGKAFAQLAKELKRIHEAHGILGRIGTKATSPLIFQVELNKASFTPGDCLICVYFVLTKEEAEKFGPVDYGEKPKFIV